MNRQVHEMIVVLSADKKKAAILGSLAVLALGMWVRTALFTSGPSEANAAGESTISASESEKARLAKAGDHDSEERDTFKKIIVIPAVKPLARDYFALSDALLAPSAQTDRAAPDDPKSIGGTDDKSIQPVRESQAMIEERVREEAGRLSLRSTMIGSSPVAVIAEKDAKNHPGVVVRLGGVIGGFTLVEVRALDVEIEKDGVRVVLKRDPS